MKLKFISGRKILFNIISHSSINMENINMENELLIKQLLYIKQSIKEKYDRESEKLSKEQIKTLITLKKISVTQQLIAFNQKEKQEKLRNIKLFKDLNNDK